MSPRLFKKAKGSLYLPPSVPPSIRLPVCPSICPSVCPSCYLLLNHLTNSTKFGVWVTHMNGACNVKLFWPCPLGPWGGVKRSNIINFNYKVNFKDFYTKLCVCSHKWKIQNISDVIFILSPGSCPRVGLWGAGGAQGVNLFFKHGHVAYQIDGDDKKNRMQIQFSSWWPWGEVKRSNIIKFLLPCQF